MKISSLHCDLVKKTTAKNSVSLKAIEKSSLVTLKRDHTVLTATKKKNYLSKS